MSAVVPWEQLPKQMVYITRHWRTRGIYKRVAAVLTSGYYTNEDSGVGVSWTPYTLDYDCFLTLREAWAHVYTAYTAADQDLDRQKKHLAFMHGKAGATYNALFEEEEQKTKEETT